MVDIVVLDPSVHADVRVKAGASELHGDDQRFVRIVLREFPLAVVHYPILLTKDAETGAFFCGAMLGIDPHENLFFDRRGKMISYRPLTLQRAPFYLAGDRLAIDLDSSRVSVSDGEPLFDDAGEPTSFTRSILNAFRELKPGIDATAEFIAELLQFDLIEPIDISLSFDDGEKRDLRDLYTIDQDRLRALSDDVVLDLFKKGHLHSISLMIASLKQIPVLARRRNEQLLPESHYG
ncbi:multidrug transporter [Sphingomonas koreensis]|nr:multidrug transporter [Sphingomonas koreensis]